MAIYSDRPRRHTPPHADHYRYEATVKSMNPDLNQWNHRTSNSLDEAWVHVPSASSSGPPRRNHPQPPPPAPVPPKLPREHVAPARASPPRNPAVRSRHDLSYEQQAPATRSRHDLSYEQQAPATRSRHDVSYEQQPPPARSRHDVSYEQQTLPTRSRHDSSHEQQNPAVRSRHDVTYEQQPPPARSRHDVSYEQQTVPTRSRHEIPYEQQVPAVRTRHDSSYEQQNPAVRSKHDVTYEQQIPVPRSRHDVTYDPQNVRYSPQRGSQSSIPYRSGYPSPGSLPTSQHTRSYSRPGSSHASDGPPPAPAPPPLSFVSHVRQHNRRRSSQPKESPKRISRSVKTWPPENFSKRDVLSKNEAEKLISKGASTFAGYEEEVRNAPGHFKFFAIMRQENSVRTDRAPFLDPSFESMTLSLDDRGDSSFPWTSLEQPSTTAAFGKSPGTTTLTYFVGKSGSLQSPLVFASKAKARKMKLIAILERLQELQMTGLQDVEEFQRTYTFLYTKLIEDPEAQSNPHYDRALQIGDLLTVLSNPEWIDFSLPRNQVVAKYFDSHEEKIKRKFFHQLLLSVELYLRIESPEHAPEAKSALLASIPPKVAWDLALAKRWSDNMLIERTQTTNTQSTFSFKLSSKKRQKEALWAFAQALKWPNLDELGYILEEKDRDEKSIEDRSADAMSWFTGVILPGVTLPWLLMNTLIDCDRDTGEELTLLTHMHPNSGFQYRANTYWSSQCIVGKVLGASRGVKQVAGWIGPCYYTPELERAQCVIVKQLEPLDQRLVACDLENMNVRSSPLGPDADDFPVQEYDIIVPDTSENDDIIRIQKLSFTPRENLDSRGNQTHDAAIVFAGFAGATVALRLRYNVDFINAFPCTNGPHPLHYSYGTRTVRVDHGLEEITNWAARNNLSRSSRRSRTSSPALYSSSRATSRAASPLRALSPMRDTSHAMLRLEGRLGDGLNIRSRSVSPAPTASKGIREVLVIEAFGVSDNEVFARAWCAQYGVSAVVANVRETCVACAVREAYAACVTVVILTEGGSGKEEDSIPKKGDVGSDYE